MTISRFKARIAFAVVALAVITTFQNCGAPKKDSLASDSASSSGGGGNNGGGGGNPAFAPAAPSQLNGVAKSSAQVDLTWVDNSNNETGFKVERYGSSSGPFAGGGGSFNVVTTTQMNENHFSDTGLMPATQYMYRVSAINASGASAVTSTVTVTTPNAPSTPPSPPSTLAAAPSAATIVTINWNDNSNNETYFKIERSTGGGAFAQVASTSADVHTYEDINLQPATAYSYRVRATNGAGDSTYTNTGSATTLAAGNTNSYAYLQTNVIGPNCVACHGGSITSAGVNVATYNGVQNLGGTRLVQVITNGSMPPGAPLSATQINQIKAWVNSGSPNN